MASEDWKAEREQRRSDPQRARLLVQLRHLSDEDLVSMHDQLAPNTIAGIDYYLDELARREAEHQAERLVVLTEQTAKLNEQMVRLTWCIAGLTIVIAIASIVGAVSA